MPIYEYQAIARTGKTVKGLIDADSAVNARRKLREQELHPTKLKEGAEKGAVETKGGMSARISLRDVAMMTRQMAVLLQAGMSLSEALSALRDQTTNARLRKVIFEIRDRVNEGSTLADALAAHPRVFTQLYANMVSAGEASGTLEAVLFRLADMLEHQVELKNQVTFALVYPACMAAFGTAVILFLMIVIVPRVTRLFDKQGRVLPLITRILITMCDFLRDRWWLLALIIVGLVALWRFWVSRPEGRRRWDSFKLRAPMIGPLYVKMVCARFARTLGTMLGSGLTMLNALEVVKTILGNRVLENLMDDIKAAVRRGRELSVPMKESGMFPPLLIHMTELGERSGELESMMMKISETYDGEVRVAVDALVRLLEPLMLIVMGCFVGFLVIAILLPIIQLTSGIQ